MLLLFLNSENRQHNERTTVSPNTNRATNCKLSERLVCAAEGGAIFFFLCMGKVGLARCLRSCTYTHLHAARAHEEVRTCRGLATLGMLRGGALVCDSLVSGRGRFNLPAQRSCAAAKIAPLFGKPPTCEALRGRTFAT